jgi:hypothetical protein
MKLTIDPRAVPNGQILIFGIQYPGLTEPSKDATRGRTQPKTFTYAALKAGNLWYFTGGAKAPQAAGWGAIEKWLARDNRTVVWVSAVTQTETIYAAPEPEDPVIDASYMERRMNRQAMEPGMFD